MQTHRVTEDVIYVAVVDDDASVCRSLARLLRTAGFQPVTYESAEAFLEDAKRPRFDCLVLDIQLEGMSGLELSQRLSAVKDNTPVVFITAHDDPAVRAEAEMSGCVGYFRKTEPGEVILRAINRAVDHGNQGQPKRTAPTDTSKGLNHGYHPGNAESAR